MKTWARPQHSLEHHPTMAAVLSKIDEITERELAFYENLTPEAFFRSVETSWGPAEPLIQLATSFLVHEGHHRGQMVTYLRLKGMVPAKY